MQLHIALIQVFKTHFKLHLKYLNLVTKYENKDQKVLKENYYK